MEIAIDEELGPLTSGIVRALRDAGRTVAVVESLTSGQLAQLIGCAPGSGDVFAGGVVTYSRDAKARVLQISPETVVDAETALAMAEQGRTLFGVDLCVSLTGVAGPEPQDDQPVGTVFVGWASETDSGVEPWSFDGEPDEIRAQSCEKALQRLCSMAAT